MKRSLFVAVVVLLIAGCTTSSEQPQATEDPGSATETTASSESADEEQSPTDGEQSGEMPDAEEDTAAESDTVDDEEDVPWVDVDSGERHEVAFIALRDEEPNIDGLSLVTDDEAEEVALEICTFLDEGYTPEEVYDATADGFSESPAFGDTDLENQYAAAGAFMAFSMILECPEYEGDLDAALAALTE